jgi:acyl carrier protein
MIRNRTELLNVFRATATEVAEKDFSAVAVSTSIAELGIDSLGMLEIIGSLERELRIQIPDESLAGILTVNDLLNAVESRQTDVAVATPATTAAAPAATTAARVQVGESPR